MAEHSKHIIEPLPPKHVSIDNGPLELLLYIVLRGSARIGGVVQRRTCVVCFDSRRI